MPGDLPVAVKEFIFSVPVTGALATWQSLLSTQQKADLAGLTPCDGFIIAPTTDSIMRADLTGTRPTELHEVTPGSSWQMPCNNWLLNSSVKSKSGGAATAILIVYAQ